MLYIDGVAALNGGLRVPTPIGIPRPETAQILGAKIVPDNSNKKKRLMDPILLFVIILIVLFACMVTLSFLLSLSLIIFDKNTIKKQDGLLLLALSTDFRTKVLDLPPLSLLRYKQP